MVRSSTTVLVSHVALWKHLLPSLYYNMTKLFHISLFKVQSWSQTSGSLIRRATARRLNTFVDHRGSDRERYIGHVSTETVPDI